MLHRCWLLRATANQFRLMEHLSSAARLPPTSSHVPSHFMSPSPAHPRSLVKHRNACTWRKCPGASGGASMWRPVKSPWSLVINYFGNDRSELAAPSRERARALSAAMEDTVGTLAEESAFPHRPTILLPKPGATTGPPAASQPPETQLRLSLARF